MFFLFKNIVSSYFSNITKYLDCYWNQLQKDPEKYSDSQHFYYRNLGNLLRDLCTDGSQMRQGKIINVF